MYFAGPSTRCIVIATLLIVAVSLSPTRGDAQTGRFAVEAVEDSVIRLRDAEQTIPFRITRTGDLSEPAAVFYEAISGGLFGSAVPEEDFLRAVGTLTFPAGQSEEIVPVSIPGGVSNSDKTFSFRLTGATGPVRKDALGTFLVAPRAIDVEIADLNADGLPDIVVGQDGTAGMLFRNVAPDEGGATESFENRFVLDESLSVGGRRGASAVAVGDFDGDGRPDIAVVFATSSVIRLFLNRSSPGGEFSFIADGEITNLENPLSIVAADLDGDARAELVITSRVSSSVTIFNNRPAFSGAARFSQGQKIRNVTSAREIVAVDFDRDGKLDLAVSNGRTSAGFVSIFANQSTVATGPIIAPPITCVTGREAFDLVGADFNGDGVPDLAVANKVEDTASVLINRGDRLSGECPFRERVDFPVGDQPFAIKSADFNRDQRPDLLVALFSIDNPTARESGREPEGTVTLSVLTNVTSRNATIPAFLAPRFVGAGTGPYQVAASDLDADGRPDIAAANFQGGSVALLKNLTPVHAQLPSFGARTDIGVGGSPTAVVAADFNSDGVPDLAVRNSVRSTYVTQGPSISILLGQASEFGSAYLPRQDVLITGDSALIDESWNSNPPSAMAAGDFDGDGRPDLVTARVGSDDVAVLRNQTVSGDSTARFAAPISILSGRLPWSITTGDFNRDGRPDLALAYGRIGSVEVLINQTAVPGQPSFRRLGTPLRVDQARALAVGDFNGDGKADLAVSTGDGASVFLNSTASQAGAPTRFITPQVVATGEPVPPRSIVVGDFDRDGRLDLALHRSSDSQNVVRVLRQTSSSGGVLAFDSISVSMQATGIGNQTHSIPGSMVAADFNSDRRLDLAVLDTRDGLDLGDNGITLLINASSSLVPEQVTFDEPVYLRTGRTPVSVAAIPVDLTPGPEGERRAEANALAVANLSSLTVSTLPLQVGQASFDPEPAIGTILRNAVITPDAFEFAGRENVQRRSYFQPAQRIVSLPIEVTGIEAPTDITVSGGQYSVNGGPWRSGRGGFANNGDRIRVRHFAADDFDTEARTTLILGASVRGRAVRGTFVSRTRPAPPRVEFTSVGRTLANENEASVRVVVRLSEPSAFPTIVPLTYSGSATRLEDFTIRGVNSAIVNGAVQERLRIPAGQTTARFDLVVIPDTRFESNETVVVGFAPAPALRMDDYARPEGQLRFTLTIRDDDAQSVAEIRVPPQANPTRLPGQHCVRFTAVDSAGTGLRGIPLTIDRTGGNGVDKVSLSSGSGGAAEYCWTGTVRGARDTVTITAGNNPSATNSILVVWPSVSTN